MQMWWLIGEDACVGRDDGGHVGGCDGEGGDFGEEASVNAGSDAGVDAYRVRCKWRCWRRWRRW